MKLLLIFLCIVLTGCPDSEHKYITPAKHQIERVPQSSKHKYPACKKTTVIAVIDTGFGGDDTWAGQEKARLCKFGHKDFTEGETSKRFNTVDPVPVDNHGHGTHIAGTIDAYARQTNNSYCLLILKYYDPNGYENLNLIRAVQAINYAKAIGADIINYSGGGLEPNQKEAQAVRAFIDGGGTFVAAAGNEGEDLAKKHYYPAEEDDRVIAVGNGRSEDARVSSSNYGKRVNRWEYGKNLLVYNHKMTGTSQSAAIATGKIVAEKNKSCK